MKLKIEDRGNLYTYLFFVCLALTGILYGSRLADSQMNIRVWDTLNILFLGVGIPFVFLQTMARLPNFWQSGIGNKHRFWIPFAIGIVFGLLDLLVFKILLHPEAYHDLPPFLQPFPYSIFLYVSGAFEVEVFYRLIPLTLIMLLGTHYKKGRYLNHFFWTAAVLTSLREPLEQVLENALWVVAYALVTGFIMNLIQAIYFRKAGFLASLTLRLGHYLIWHILLGIYIESYEIII